MTLYNYKLTNTTFISITKSIKNKNVIKLGCTCTSLNIYDSYKNTI